MRFFCWLGFHQWVRTTSYKNVCRNCFIEKRVHYARKGK